MYRVNFTSVIQTVGGWTFYLNGVRSPGTYLTRTVARARLAMHKAARTAFYFEA